MENAESGKFSGRMCLTASQKQTEIGGGGEIEGFDGGMPNMKNEVASSISKGEIRLF